MSDTIGSFLVALGFDVKSGEKTAADAKKAMVAYEAAVKEAEKRVQEARLKAAKSAEDAAVIIAEAEHRAAHEALNAARDIEAAAAKAAAAKKKESKDVADAIGFAVTKFNLMAQAAIETAQKIGGSISGTIQQLDALYYTAGRTGATVQSIKGLGYAFSQVGGTVGQAVSALESFAKASRTNEGVKGLVRDFGIDTTKDTAQQVLDLVDKLKQMPYQEGAQYAELAGIDENSFKLLSDYSDKVRKFYAERAKTAKDFHLDENKAAKASAELMQGLGSLSMTVEVGFTKLLTAAAPRLSGWIDNLSQWIKAHQQQIGEWLEQGPLK